MLLIKKVLPILLQTKLTFWFHFKLVKIWIFDFSIKDLQSCSNLLIGTNPRLFLFILILIKKSIFFARAPSSTIYFKYFLLFIIIYNPIQIKVLWNRTNDVEPRAFSFLEKMMDVRIHIWWCPSSRTLLSTTSFQTKFYHNIPQIFDFESVWNWFNMSIWNHE